MYTLSQKKFYSPNYSPISDYSTICVISEYDIRNNLICLKGITCDLILFPKSERNNKEANTIARMSLIPNGEIKYY